MSEAVVVRRKSDGKYLSGGNGRITHFAETPRALKTRSRAIMVIRCDMGLDLGDFDILPASAVKTREKCVK